jgi:hypothetical protein
MNDDIIGAKYLDEPDLEQKLLFGVIEGAMARGVAIHLAHERTRLRGQIEQLRQHAAELQQGLRYWMRHDADSVRRAERAEAVLEAVANTSSAEQLYHLLSPYRRPGQPSL